MIRLTSALHAGKHARMATSVNIFSLVWFRRYPEYNAQFVVNYDSITEDDPITGDEVGENETLNVLTLGELLIILQEQNKIL